MHRPNARCSAGGPLPSLWLLRTMGAGLFVNGQKEQDLTGEKFRNPLLTVDIIIEVDDGIVLIERKNPPHGWALPGGFVDYGESLETAAVREAREETSLRVRLTDQFHTYSNPDRDPRHHTVSTVFIAKSDGIPRAADDARRARVVRQDNLPDPVVFDHPQILRDYFAFKKNGRRPRPM